MFYFPKAHCSIFSMKIHHMGVTRFSRMIYVQDLESEKFNVDIGEFSIHELDAWMQNLGYDDGYLIYYHLLIHGVNLYFGLRALDNDSCVLRLSKYMTNNKLIYVLTEHDVTKFSTFSNSPHLSRVFIQGIYKDMSAKPIYRRW